MYLYHVDIQSMARHLSLSTIFQAFHLDLPSIHMRQSEQVRHPSIHIAVFLTPEIQRTTPLDPFKMSSLLPVTVKPATISTTQRRTAHSPPAKKQKASLIQSYYLLAYTVRGKLLKEATRVGHDLRLVVGHANFLDGLMLDIANFEQEQEISFKNIVESAANASEEPKQSQRVSWTDQLINSKERCRG